LQFGYFSKKVEISAVEMETPCDDFIRREEAGKISNRKILWPRYNWRMKKIFFIPIFFVFVFVHSAFAENTATIPAARTFPTNWMSQHETFVAQAKQGGIDLLFVGDSITAGWQWDKGGLNVWNKCYAPRHAAGFGIGYDRTQNVLWRMENGELDGIKPKVVVLLIGTNNAGNENDGKPRNSTPEIIEGVTAIVKDLQVKLPESKVLLLAIFPRGQTNDPVRVQLKEVNTGLAKLDDGKMVRFLDLGAKFLESDGTLSRDIFPDLLHPNEKGYRIWADAMEGTLAEMIK
jgi:lysophospholipase L1-like esterase